jgi:hypothetical protein
MRRVLLPVTLLAIMFGVALTTAPAQAQASRTWVSGVGDDANPCSRTAPCKTFAGTISKTAAGGEINCIDPGGFGTLTITKAITIDCANTEAGVLASGTNAFTVNAGLNDVVVLRGLDIIGTLAVPALNGIVFNTGAAQHVEKCNIREFLSAGANGFGILFQPTGAAELYVTDSFITNNGSGSAGGAIMVRPTGSGSAKVAINNVNANNNITGITADGGSTPNAITVTVRDSVSAGASFIGFSAVTPAAGGGTTIIMLDHTASLSNTTGISSVGAKSFVVMNDVTVVGNTTGLSPTSSGQIFTFKNNVFNIANGSDGTTTANGPLQ